MKLSTKIALVTILIVIIVAFTRPVKNVSVHEPADTEIGTITQMRYIQGIAWVLADDATNLYKASATE